jgi:hypothetical protein
MPHLAPSDWRGYGTLGFPAKSWRADGEMLWTVPDGPRVDLVSHGRYTDFMLSFEWWLPAGGNSGVLYRVDESLAQSWQSGPELQLVDDERHPDGADPLTACGALYGLLPPLARTAPLPDTFRTGRVRVQGSAVEHWLDGRRILQYDLTDPALAEAIAASKFREYPRFASGPEGHIVLQHHGTAAGFRRLQVDAD